MIIPAMNSFVQATPLMNNMKFWSTQNNSIYVPFVSEKIDRKAKLERERKEAQLRLAEEQKKLELAAAEANKTNLITYPPVEIKSPILTATPTNTPALATNNAPPNPNEKSAPNSTTPTPSAPVTPKVEEKPAQVSQNQPNAVPVVENANNNIQPTQQPLQEQAAAPNPGPIKDVATPTKKQKKSKTQAANLSQWVFAGAVSGFSILWYFDVVFQRWISEVMQASVVDGANQALNPVNPASASASGVMAAGSIPSPAALGTVGQEYLNRFSLEAKKKWNYIMVNSLLKTLFKFYLKKRKMREIEFQEKIKEILKKKV